ncbi:copper homeostasis periplasmic binding protein CopC [Mesorhizobium sp. KR2-14]|uniref:copper homeostasis periplasmic binding protein CopC n=1 Tax=Mesorhizobium sp. KR2-14 TaxID=3156610 RepID=UPI0032B51456
MPVSKSLFLPFALASLATTFFADYAFAHAKLASETPAAHSTAKPAPAELRLKFSEALELKFTGVKVMGPRQDVIETGPAVLDPNDDTTLIVPFKSPLPDGRYTVDWHVLSKDGHKTKGTYWFEATH